MDEKELFAKSYGYTQAELAEIGLEVVTCDCGKSYCNHFMFARKAGFDLRTFNHAVKVAR